jgi:hypothetical protein
MVLRTDTVVAATDRERCRDWWWVVPTCEAGFVSSSAGSVLLLSVARAGVNTATGAAKSNMPAKQQIAGLACSEAKRASDRF